MSWKYTIDGKPSKVAPTGDQMLETLKRDHPLWISSTPDLAKAVIDLSDPYDAYVQHLTRTFEMRGRSSVALVEEMEAKEPL